MKKIVKSIFMAALSMMVCTSCESYFDSVPSNVVSLDAVFSNRGLALQWLSNTYSYLPDETSQNYTRGDDETKGIWTPACLEAKLPWDQCNSNHINLGTLYPSTGYVENMWKSYYKGIQKANIYMANIDRCTAMEEYERLWSKAEARALRSIYYYNLFKLYGPFVIIGDEVFDVEGDVEAMMRERSSVDECVDYMVGEFDAILSEGRLKSHFGEDGAMNPQFAGNITKEAVEAIRSELLLYAASPLFNGDSYYKNLTNVDGKHLFPQTYSREKWEKAKTAAENFMKNNPGFQLLYLDKKGAATSDVASSCPYTSVTQASLGRTENTEMIFFRTGGEWNIYYTMTPKHSGITNAQSGGGALAAPLQMIDLFFTENGLSIEKDPEYFTYTDDDLTAAGAAAKMTSQTVHQNPFSKVVYFRPDSKHKIMKQFYNREPRFYAAFTFQNRRWDLDDKLVYYTDFSLNGNSGQAKNGHDYPRSGVLVRKKRTNVSGVNYYVYIRLSEIYLNYAEACCELDDIGTAINYVNKIRLRAGIPEYKGLLAEDLTPTDKRGFERITLDSYDKEFVKKVIYRERLLELSYENHHYFDVRRWGVADMATGDGWIYPSWHNGGEGGDMVGFDVTVDMASDDAKDPLLFYKRKVWETRVYSKRMSLFPIPQTEINRNARIVQNTGWETEM